MTCVLVIDDDDDIRIILRRVLEGAGYLVLDAHSGPAGIAFCATYPVDVVLLDLLMPDQDGFETLRMLRRLPRVPKVIVMSGGGVKEDRSFLTMAALLGAQQVLQKPMQGAEALAAVQAVLAREGGSDAI